MRGLKYATLLQIVDQLGRTPQGVRGLKLLIGGAIGIFGRRTPQGVRGLKFEVYFMIDFMTSVAPRKGCVD